jgi:uncharacterized HhH-GPD family protein
MAAMATYLTGNATADALLDSDLNALLIGMLLDQQVPMEKAFSGPAVIAERMGGTFDVAAIAAMDEEEFVALCAAKPAIHRYPGSMAKRVHDLAVYLLDNYDGDAARVWTEATTGDELRANLTGLPGFGEMKVKSLGSVLAKHFGVEAAEELVPWHPTLGDVDSPQALADYQAAKRVHKAEWSKARARA